MANGISLSSFSSLSSLSSFPSMGSFNTINAIGIGLVCATSSVTGTIIRSESQPNVINVITRQNHGNLKIPSAAKFDRRQGDEEVVAADAGNGEEKGDSDPNGNGQELGSDGGGQADTTATATAGGDVGQDGATTTTTTTTTGITTPSELVGLVGGSQLITACTVPGTAALTFDDGPYAYTEEVSRLLKENNAVGTFFFNGQNFGCINSPENAARVKVAYNAGHQIASHSWGHKDLATLPKDQILNEMSAVSQAIHNIVGVTPAQMRPPYGSYNDLVIEAATELGQDIVIWNFDSGDSMNASAEQSKTAYKSAVDQKIPILSLNHETHETTVKEVLPAAIKTLQDAGYRLVSVAECTGREAYMRVDTPTLPPSNLNCS